MTTTMTTCSDRDVQALRDEAGNAGDLKMVAICDRALDGDETARRTCAQVIDDARAMAEVQ